MFLARVIGVVVATKKDPEMEGRKLLILRTITIDEKNPGTLKESATTFVAVDSVGAGEGELVMFCQGSSARMAPGMKQVPVDAVIIGIVDSVDVLGHKAYTSGK